MDQSDLDLLTCMSELSDDEKHRRTLAGLADVDAGRTIPAEEVKRWAQSLLRLNDRPNSPE